MNTRPFSLYFAINKKKSQNGHEFIVFHIFFAKQTAKMHKIASFEDDMRKILRPKIWSQGTPLGSMGPLSLKDPDQRFPKHYFLLIWDTFYFPKLVALSTMAEKLKAIAAWCGDPMNLVSRSY